jgi:hypothetical protein
VFTLTNPEGGIPINGPIVFDQLAIPVQGTAISYNNTTGTVTFNETGFYKVTYAASIVTEFNTGQFAISLNPGGIVSGTAYDIGNLDNNSLISPVTIILQIATVGTTMQVVNTNFQCTTDPNSIPLSACDTDNPDSCATQDSVLAYLLVKKLP